MYKCEYFRFQQKKLNLEDQNANWAINVRLSVNHLSSTCADNSSLSNSLIIKTIREWFASGLQSKQEEKGIVIQKINVAKLILFNFFSRLQMCGQAGTIKIVWLSTCGFQRPLGLAVHCWATRDNQHYEVLHKPILQCIYSTSPFLSQKVYSLLISSLVSLLIGLKFINCFRQTLPRYCHIN